MLAPGPVSDPIPIQRAVVPGSAAARAGLEHGDII
jgi:S1-C subfamily serine protease